jgi:hypothetical protein
MNKQFCVVAGFAFLLLAAALPAAQETGRPLDDEIKQLEREARKISAEVEERLKGPEWQEKVKRLEEAAARMSSRFESPEWKAQVQQIEEMSKKIEAEVKAKFEGPEWQEKIRRINEMAANLDGRPGRGIDDEAWAGELDALRQASRAVQEEVRKFFDSPEWKDQVRMLQEAARELRQKR